MKKLLFIFILFVIFISCKKLETDPPVVTIYSPAATDSFYVADSVRLNFTVTDKNLSSYKIIISNYYSHKLLYHEEVAVDSTTATVFKNVFVNVDSDTTAYLNVLGIDKNGNTGGAGTTFLIKK